MACMVLAWAPSAPAPRLCDIGGEAQGHIRGQATCLLACLPIHGRRSCNWEWGIGADEDGVSILPTKLKVCGSPGPRGWAGGVSDRAWDTVTLWKLNVAGVGKLLLCQARVMISSASKTAATLDIRQHYSPGSIWVSPLRPPQNRSGPY